MSYNAILKNENRIANYEGETAFAMTPEMELYTTAVTASLSGKFYETTNELIERIACLIPKVSPEFVARLAVYTRNEMNLRSIPLLLIVELAKCHNGDNLVSKTIAKTVLRADEISELLVCYQWRNPSSGAKKLGRLSRQIQDGLKKAFNRFDEYQFAKYDRPNQSVKLRDALFLVHPKADSPEKQAIFDRIANGTLMTPYTWETQLSELGQKHITSEEKAAALKTLWEELLDSGKLGYMALLRNLRNILGAGVSVRHIKELCARLSDPVQVKNSRQLPFRFLAAYKEVMALRKDEAKTAVLDALEKAALTTVENIKGFDAEANVLLACDVSGSMFQPVSEKGSIELIDIGILLASILRTKCANVQTGIFGDTWKTIETPETSVLRSTIDIRKREGEVGYSTNGYRVINWLARNKIRMDKVMFFTDCQLWNSTGDYGSIASSWKKYKAMFPEAKLYIFDLAGYGHSPLRLAQKDVYLIAGWSDKIFNVLEALEKGKDVLDRVNQIEL